MNDLRKLSITSLIASTLLGICSNIWAIGAATVYTYLDRGPGNEYQREFVTSSVNNVSELRQNSNWIPSVLGTAGIIKIRLPKVKIAQRSGIKLIVQGCETVHFPVAVLTPGTHNIDAYCYHLPGRTAPDPKKVQLIVTSLSGAMSGYLKQYWESPIAPREFCFKVAGGEPGIDRNKVFYTYTELNGLFDEMTIHDYAGGPLPPNYHLKFRTTNFNEFSYINGLLPKDSNTILGDVRDQFLGCLQGDVPLALTKVNPDQFTECRAEGLSLYNDQTKATCTKSSVNEIEACLGGSWFFRAKFDNCMLSKKQNSLYRANGEWQLGSCRFVAGACL